MKQHKINERLWVVGNFEVSKTALGHKRINGDYLLVKRTGGNQWVVRAGQGNIPSPAYFPGAPIPTQHATRAAAIREAVERVEFMKYDPR